MTTGRTAIGANWHRDEPLLMGRLMAMGRTVDRTNCQWGEMATEGRTDETTMERTVGGTMSVNGANCRWGKECQSGELSWGAK